METPSRKKTHPGNIILSVVAVIVIIGAIIYFTNYFLTSRKYLETNDAQVESYINPISARVGGYIKNVKFEEHELVKQGDTLLTIDDREYRIYITEAEAAVDDANAQLILLSAGVASAKTSYAKITEMRSRKALLIANLKMKMALLDLAHINLSYTVIKAPYAGRMGCKVIQVGQQIQAGQPLVSIIDEKDKWVTANFKETQIYEMYVGQPVDIRVDAIDDKVYHGQIEAISAATGAKFSLLPPDNATGNFVKIVQRIPVKIKFTSIDIAPVKAGMNVLVSVKKKAK